jgi:UDP-3-O-[3-hydroxymyristoyl] N-acetylglucosamine deacetylase
MHLQRTIKQEINCRNIGLHSGRKVSMTIRPSGVDEGVVFIRKDLPGGVRIKADFENVRDTVLATTIGLNGATVSTVEHLLSALCGMGVDNAVVEVDAPEIPIMDGSALPFVNLLKDVGTTIQNRCKRLLVIKKRISVSEGDGTAMLLPSPEFKITYGIDFEHPLIRQQSYDMIFSDVTYERDICQARTFGFLKDVEYLQAKGLALGGSLRNAVVLDEQRVINKEGLRCHDEFVKHKILDAIGDLSLLGMPIIGHFVAYKSGHRLNNLLLKELMAHQECWKMVSHIEGESGEEEFKSLNIPSFSILDTVNAPASVA